MTFLFLGTSGKFNSKVYLNPNWIWTQKNSTKIIRSLGLQQGLVSSLEVFTTDCEGFYIVEYYFYIVSIKYITLNQSKINMLTAISDVHQLCVYVMIHFFTQMMAWYNGQSEVFYRCFWYLISFLMWCSC